MAITIYQQPQKITPVYNDMYFTVLSDNIIETNFKYIFDIYYNSSLQQTIKIPARPDGYAVYSPARILENEITFDITESDFGFMENENSYMDFYIKFGEEYDVGGVLTEFPDLATSNVITAFNAALDPLEFLDYDYTDYGLSDSTKIYLTNSPSTLSIDTGQSAWLYGFVASGNIVDRMNIITYDSSNNVIDTHKVSNPLAAASGFARFGSGIIQLNQIDAGDFISGGQPVITASVAKYTLQVMNSSNVAVSELFTYNIEDTSCKYDNFRLHWFNKLGGFDSFNFDLVSRKRIGIERKSYKKNLGSLIGTSFIYDSMSRGKKDYDVIGTEIQRITSNWITEAQSIWMEDLLTSPEVYYEDSNNNLIAINITNSEYEVKKKQNDKLINIEIEFTFSFNKQRQRG